MRLTLFCLLVAIAVTLSATAETFAQYSKHMAPRSGFGGGGFGHSAAGRTASAHPGLGRPNNLSLVVAQTQEGHEGVSDLLGQLRRLQDQQVKQEVRFNTLNDSFYERQGVNFGFNLRGSDPASGRGIVGLDPTGQATPNGDLQFRQGSAASAVPQFGGYDPAADATFGFANRGNDGDLLFNFFSGQGSTRSSVTQAPVIVTSNGAQGTVSDTSQTPFVTGVIPVVGAPSMAAITGYPVGGLVPQQQSVVQQRLQQLKYERMRQATQRSTSPAEQGRQARVTHGPAEGEGSIRLSGGSGNAGSSSADRGDLSVAEIRRQQQSTRNADDSELAAWIERARGAEAAGKDGVAKIYYKMAARRAEGDQKQQLIEKVRQFED